MTRTRLRLLATTATAALAVVALAAGGQPASATPATASASGHHATRPVPVDPGARGVRSHAQPQRVHIVPNELLKEQFAEEEEDDGGDGPTLSALCQQYIGQPNPYRNPAPNVDAISGDTIVPAGSQTGCSSAQNETTIAVNPYNPRNVVAGSNDYRFFNTREQRNDATGVALTSFDGGRTWANVVLPKLDFQTGGTGALAYMDSAGDPAIAFGPNNTVYYANLVFSRVVPADGSQQASGIAVSVSHDGGRSFGDPVVVQLDGVTAAGVPTRADVFNDKEWIAADPVRGTVYVTWTRFTYDSDGNYLESPIMSASSTDSGRSFSTPTRVSPPIGGGITPYASGTSPQVGNDGTLSIAYETSVCKTAACDRPTDHDAVVVATSRDGGRTYRTVEVASDFDFPATLTGENFRLNSFPVMAYDRVTDRLWITWADDRNGSYDSSGRSVKTNGDVFVVGSQHGSVGWSKPAKLGSGADEWFPGVAAVAGRVAVSYYTRAFDPNGIGVDYAYSTGWNDQIGKAGLRRITTQTQNPQVQFVSADAAGNQIQGVFIGDYSAVAMGADLVLHPCWTDFRGNPGSTAPNQDVYTQAIPALF
jgi:hypothetical protein